MTREEKKSIIDELSQKFKENNFLYFTDSSGLSVAQINAFRRLCYERGIEYRVVKNTLIKKALETLDGDFSALDKALKGFTGIMFHPESGNLAAKVLKEYQKKGTNKPALKGASIDSDLFVGAENLDMLSSLKSKQELIGDIVFLLQSPAKNVISALSSGSNTLAGLVKTLSERQA